MVKLREEFHREVDHSIEPEIWFNHVAENRTPQEIQILRQAFDLSMLSGADIPSFTGISCLQYGLAMADILDNLNMDLEATVAAMVYPTYAKADLNHEDITEHLGKNITELVTGVEKMDAIRSLYDEIHNHQLHPSQIDNIRKMLLAMVQDVRIVLIKLAEHTVLMRSMQHFSELQKQRIAKETRDLYAPLANRLGIAQIKWELEDLAFRYLDPDNYKNIAKSISLKRMEREAYVENIMSTLKEHIAAQEIKTFEVMGRAKHIFSIYKKMQRKNVDFSQIYDAIAVRVLVPTVEDCYNVLGIAHSLWEPIPEEYDDYITNPKPNGYKSLHTAVKGPQGRNVEIQVRTWQMHEESELGVAAHWVYKEGGGKRSSYDQKIAWLRQIIDWQKEVSHTDKDELAEKQLQFEDSVYVFTPNSEIVDLTIGSTPLDFAYSIHTEIGHRCRGAKVNGHIVPLTYQLQMGDRVEILTTKESNPSRDWLNPNLGYLKSSRAKAKIHHWFKVKNHDKNVHLGKDMLDRELKKLHIHQYDHAALMARFNHTNAGDFLAALGAGGLRIGQLINAIEQQIKEKQKLETAEAEPKFATPAHAPKKPLPPSAVNIQGIGNLLYHMASCCKPIPGDDILGFITQGRGVSIHRKDCPNMLAANHEQKQRFIEVDWGEEQGKYPVDIFVHAYDRHGIVRDITLLLANEKINLTGLNTVTNKKDHTAHVTLTIELTDLNNLSRIMDRLNQISNVIKVERGV
jgi:GTP pyrophosphokinase